MKRRIKKNKTLGHTVAPVFTLILTPNGSKKAWPPRKTPQNDRNVYIFNVHVCNTTTRIRIRIRRGKKKR
jgi:hypothetical protein